MDSLPQRSAAFAMDHPDFVYAGLPAFGKVFRQQISDFGGPERMKVEFSGDRQGVGVVVHFVEVPGFGGRCRAPADFSLCIPGGLRVVLPPADKNGGRSSMVEPQIVILVVAGSSPVGHPTFFQGGISRQPR